jgi:hypothetical protein
MLLKSGVLYRLRGIILFPHQYIWVTPVTPSDGPSNIKMLPVLPGSWEYHFFGVFVEYSGQPSFGGPGANISIVILVPPGNLKHSYEK